MDQNQQQKQRAELLDGTMPDLVDPSSRAPVTPSTCTNFVPNPAPANRPSVFDGPWFGAVMLLLSGYVQGFALDGWRALAERYPGWFEGPTTWGRQVGLVSFLAVGVVCVWWRGEGRREERRG